jgi:hypothetical protein
LDGKGRFSQNFLKVGIRTGGSLEKREQDNTGPQMLLKRQQ